MSKINDTAKTVKGIVEAVPVYQDLLQPAAKELGKGLHTLSKTVHIALSPVSAMVWGYEQIKEYVQSSLEEKLKDIPKENIIPPDLSIAGPALESMRYNGHKEELREMFTNLLANAMDSQTAPSAHPSFVEIIKELNSDEAKIVKSLDGSDPTSIIRVRLSGPEKDANGNLYFGEPLINFSMLPFDIGCAHPDLGPSYLENLNRLGLVDFSYTVYNVNPNAYESVENHPIVNAWRQRALEGKNKFEIRRGAMTRTAFGKKFFESCVKRK